MLLLILAGPTAAGKSDLALELAARCDGEILAADSMQVYRLMDIGTAKPTAAERELVPHHLLDLVYPDEPFSAARYAIAFHAAAQAVGDRGRLPMVVGGTGLYIRAAVKPFLFPEASRDPEMRARLQALAARKGPAFLHDMLATVDPEAATRIHPNDARRVIRALEVQQRTGRSITAWQKDAAPVKLFQTISVCLVRERAELYRRIEERVDRMMAAGFLDEVRGLLAAGYGRYLPPMQGLGYRELASHLSGECSLERAVADLKRRTRNYAKRQLTWFRHEPGLVWVDLSSTPCAAAVMEILRLVAGRRDSPSNK